MEGVDVRLKGLEMFERDFSKKARGLSRVGLDILFKGVVGLDEVNEKGTCWSSLERRLDLRSLNSFTFTLFASLTLDLLHFTSDLRTLG